MDWLNYHHLLYFWVVAREGSVARACERLQLAQPTISHQIHELENQLGQKLFVRVGRNIQLTDHGQVVFNYADKIFTLGRELLQTIKGLPQSQPVPFQVGITGFVPQLLVWRLLQPALTLADPIQLHCRFDRAERLLADLALHQLDLVLSDVPVRPIVRVRAYSHLLGECSASFFAPTPLAPHYRAEFPQSLHGAPLLVPAENTGLRRSLEQWLYKQGIYPTVRGEFADGNLLALFGNGGAGVFLMPTVIEQDVVEHFDVEMIGQVEAIRMRCYAISVQRTLKHPACAAVVNAARAQVYSDRRLQATAMNPHEPG